MGPVPTGDIGDLLRVGRAENPLEDACLLGGRDRVREQRVTRERADVLARNALGAGAGADQRDRPHAPSSCASSDSRAGVGTPWRRPARTIAPAIASSSEGVPAATSRAVDVVRSSDIESTTAHWSAGDMGTPSAEAT